MREVIILPKLKFPSFSQVKKRKISNEEWKEHIFHAILDVYKNSDKIEIKEILDAEEVKGRRERERVLKEYFARQFEQNKNFTLKHFVVKWEPKAETNVGFYDITFNHSSWYDDNDRLIDFCFECKNLEDGNKFIREYVYNNSAINSGGGVFRFVTGKYSSRENFGGMIGFVLKNNDWRKIKLDIIDCLKKFKYNFNDAGKLTGKLIVDNSIFKNENTFDSWHLRENLDKKPIEPILLHHILLDFSD